MRSVPLLALMTLLASCGGGGSSGGSDGGGTAPPTGLTYPAPPAAYTVGVAIASLVPSSSGGAITAFSVTPALPAGLNLDPASGVISGTPAAEAATAIYTVSGANSGGRATAAVTLTVNRPPPKIGYASSSLLFITGQSNRAAPTNSGGAVSSWSITPALSAGLSLDNADGSISGMPAAPVAPVTYTITARNSGGTDSVMLTINAAGVLLDLGHVAAVGQVIVTPTRVLSVDANAHWVLWDYASAARVASGDLQCFTLPCGGSSAGSRVADLAGTIFAVQQADGVQLRSVNDGSPLATVAGPPPTQLPGNWRLSSDGSYLCSATTNGISAWAPNGALLVQRPGDYSGAHLYCASSEMRVATGPAGIRQIETISVPGGTDSVSPIYSGNFYAWFEDGESFFSTISGTVWVYSKDGGTQLDARVFSTFDGLDGAGDWFWTWSPLNIYAVGASASPALSVETTTGARWANDTIAAASGVTPNLLHLVDLSGATPLVSDHPSVPAVNAFGATSSTQWMLGDTSGRLIDGPSIAGTPRYFGYGAVFGVAGGSARFAVATALNQTLIFDAGTWTLADTLQAPVQSLALAADASVMAAMGSDGTDSFVRTYALPGVSLLQQWSYPLNAPSPQPVYMTLSGDGATLEQVLDLGNQSFRGELNGAASGTLLWSAVLPPPALQSDSILGWQPMRLSPDGSSWTTSNARDSTGTTTLYHNGTQVVLLEGWAQGWLSDERLLQVEYRYHMGNEFLFQDALLYDATGTALGLVPLPQAFLGQDIQVLGPDSFYQPLTNSIWTVSTGTQSWVGPQQNPAFHQYFGAVVGSDVVFLLGSQLLIQPH
jgi:hypothetical protein